MSVHRADLMKTWARTFSVQGSWNFRTLVGGGLAYALLPVLRRVHAGDPVALREAVDEHLEPFNAHPYLVPVAVGALARAERDGVARERIRRLRTALSGPLGTLGDRAVWVGWRPFCLLGALAAHLAGLSALWAAVLFLGVYNAGHVALRAWGFRTGWEGGLEVGARLRGGMLHGASEFLASANAALVGAVGVGLTLRVASVAGIPAATEWGAVALFLVGGALGSRWPRGGRRVTSLLLLGALAWLLFGYLASP